MDTSIVIATYNRKPLLEKCLNCLFNQDYPKDRYEIIVVDDGSTDGTGQMIKRKKSPCKLKYLPHPKRKGPAKSRNLGISSSKGEVVIFVDSDILAPPQFIKEHIRFHKINPNLIVDGPAISINEKDISSTPFNHPKVKALAFFDLFGASFITANTSCRKENLVKAKGFDEEFDPNFGWQDVELGLRLKKMGLKRIKNRRAYALHLQKEKSPQNLSSLCIKRKQRGINAILYYKKHPEAKIRKEIKLRYLSYDKFLSFFIKWEKIPLKLKENKSHLPKIWVKFYLIHSYAQGLREGMKRYNIH